MQCICLVKCYKNSTIVFVNTFFLNNGQIPNVSEPYRYILKFEYHEKGQYLSLISES